MITSEVSFIRSGSSDEMEERSSYENEMYGQRKSADPGTGTGREHGLSFSCEQTVHVHAHSPSEYNTRTCVAHMRDVANAQEFGVRREYSEMFWR